MSAADSASPVHAPPTELDVAAVLAIIGARRCDHFRAPADCWSSGRYPAARYADDQMCDPCLVRASRP